MARAPIGRKGPFDFIEIRRVSIEISWNDEWSRLERSLGYDVKDPGLTERGKLRIEWAGAEMTDGHPINLASAEGHPSAVVDRSYANQALCAESMFKCAWELDAKVYSVPRDIDQTIASLKLQSMGVKRYSDPRTDPLPGLPGRRHMKRR